MFEYGYIHCLNLFLNKFVNLMFEYGYINTVLALYYKKPTQC